MKHQNISDEQFVTFFDNVIDSLDQTIKVRIKDVNEITSNKIVSTFMNFIFTILSSKDHNSGNSNKDKQKLLKTAKDKFLNLVELCPSSLPIVFEYYNENLKLYLECILNDNPIIIQTHCEMLFQLISLAYNKNPKEFMRAAIRKTEEPILEIYSNIIKLIELTISLFPKMPNKYVSKVGPLLKLFKNIANISDEVLIYIANKEIVFILITYLLGKESPCYSETTFNPITGKNENWDVYRTFLQNAADAIDLVYVIFLRARADENENVAESAENVSEN